MQKRTTCNPGANMKRRRKEPAFPHEMERGRPAALISREGGEAARGAEPRSRRSQVPECTATLGWMESIKELFKTDVRKFILARPLVFFLSFSWGSVGMVEGRGFLIAER